MAGFFSSSAAVEESGGAGDPDGVDGVESVPARADTRAASGSGFMSSAMDGGVIISKGFMVLGADGVVAANSEGYISPGVERKDSAGEASNLTLGDGVSCCQESISCGWTTLVMIGTLIRRFSGVARRDKSALRVVQSSIQIPCQAYGYGQCIAKE